MPGVFCSTDAFLRPSSWTGRNGESQQSFAFLVGVLLAFGCIYGAVMGSFGGVLGERFWQVVYSAIKVPLLLGVTFSLSLPSFYVLNALFGLSEDFPRVVRALIATQAGVAIILASLSPYTLFWYASSADYTLAVLFNGLMFGMASVAGQTMLFAFYRRLIAQNRRHRWMLRTWLVLYAFVGIQMGWVLRPFIGNPNQPTRFFREESWGNAYEVVFQLVAAQFSR